MTVVGESAIDAAAGVGQGSWVLSRPGWSMGATVHMFSCYFQSSGTEHIE